MRGTDAGIVGALVIGLWAAACGPSGAAERSGAEGTVAEEGREEAGSVDGPRLSLQVPTPVRAGDPVPIGLRLVNEGGKPLTLELRGRPIAFDIAVEDAEGDQVWRRLEGRTVSAILQVRNLAPGDSLELRETWDQRGDDGTPVGPGTYTVRGSLPTVSRGRLEAPPVELRILPDEG